MPYQVPETTKAKLKQYLNDLVSSPFITVAPDKQWLTQVAENYLRNEEFPAIMKTVASKARSMTEADWLKQIHNSSKTKEDLAIDNVLDLQAEAEKKIAALEGR